MLITGAQSMWAGPSLAMHWFVLCMRKGIQSISMFPWEGKPYLNKQKP